MHEQRGAIAQFETDEDAEAAGYKRKLSPAQHDLVAPMNRHERRKWAAEQRTIERKAKASKTKGGGK
jgi:hypothetical protein